MPIYREIKNKNTTVLIWKYHEDDNLEEVVFLDEETSEKIKNYHFKKKIEVLMVKKMLRDLVPDYQLFYHNNGEPYLEPKDKYISISHSFPFAAVAISENKIGLDLEKIQSKLQKVKSRFLYKTEYQWTENEKELKFLTIIWAIKESLYKIHPAKYWSFREHYEVQFFDFSQSKNIHCRVFDEEYSDIYQAEYHQIEDYYLTIVTK